MGRRSSRPESSNAKGQTPDLDIFRQEGKREPHKAKSNRDPVERMVPKPSLGREGLECELIKVVVLPLVVHMPPDKETRVGGRIDVDANHHEEAHQKAFRRLHG